MVYKKVDMEHVQSLAAKVRLLSVLLILTAVLAIIAIGIAAL